MKELFSAHLVCPFHTSFFSNSALHISSFSVLVAYENKTNEKSLQENYNKAVLYKEKNYENSAPEGFQFECVRSTNKAAEIEC